MPRTIAERGCYVKCIIAIFVLRSRSEEAAAEPMVDLLNRGVSGAEIAVREADGKTESPGNGAATPWKGWIRARKWYGLGSLEPQDLVRGTRL